MTTEIDPVEALRTAFETDLKKGKVKFSFRKKDGTTRDAVGTLHASKLPALPTDEVLRQQQVDSAARFRQNNPLTVKFFDLDNGGFRSVNVDTFVKLPQLVEEYPQP